MIQIQEINKYFSKYITNIDTNDTNRKYFAEQFAQNGVPDHNNEMWQRFPWENILANNYKVNQEPEKYRPVNEFFRCNIDNIEAHLFAFLNGWYVHNNVPLTIFPSGVIVGSFRHAIMAYPQLIQPYIQRCKNQTHSSMFDLASAIYQDGFFVYIPDNIDFKQVIQMVNIVNTQNNLFINMKNMVIVGKNASLKLIHCDDTIESGNTLINTATEIFLEDGARVDYYKLENKDAKSILINDSTIYQGTDTHVNTYTNVFNGGIIHNSLNSHLLGQGGNINLNGLYLVDKKQDVTNCLSVNHHVSNCHSEQLYNGIMDDEAHSQFLGHIYVAPDAQKTEAYQTNHNILFSEKATAYTKPFLEIYADDVKCSHGATIGQLNDEAIFYMRCRGICERNAKTLLLHAFTKEVVDKITIDSLIDYTENLVQRRLNGQNITCNNCTQNCENRSINFEVQMPEL